MDGFLDRIRRGDVLVSDGAMGTMLFEHGVSMTDCPERVNLGPPELLETIADAYLRAGADIIQTNTFGASPAKLSGYDLADNTEEINRVAVEAVRRVVGDEAWVSGSVGPSGKILIPYGDTEPTVLFDSFARQVGTLIKAGVDIICVETMIDITEATLALKAIRSISKTIPVMASMTFEATAKGFYSVMGVTIERAAGDLVAAGADIIGSNCGNGAAMMVKIAREFRTFSDCPLLIQANAGLPELVDGCAVYNETPEFMAEQADQFIDIGVSVIGGCCGTGPAHIAAIRRVVDSRKA